MNVCRESSSRLKQSVFGGAKMIQKNCAKLAQVSFRQIPEPISKIITLNSVYKMLVKLVFKNECGKVERSHIKVCCSMEYGKII